MFSLTFWNMRLYHTVVIKSKAKEKKEKKSVLGNCLCVRGSKAETLFSVCSVLSLLLLHSDCKKAERKHGDKVLAGVPVQQGTREAEEREDLTIQLHLSRPRLKWSALLFWVAHYMWGRCFYFISFFLFKSMHTLTSHIIGCSISI